MLRVQKTMGAFEVEIDAFCIMIEPRVYGAQGAQGVECASLNKNVP